MRRVKETYDAHGIDYDFWWFDAGWGTDGTGPHSKSGWWYHGVNFEMNFEAFPDGLEWLGKALKREGRDFMLWFEPEVVRTPPEHLEEFFKAHPQFKREWFLGTFQKEWCGIILTAQLMDLGNAECLKWLEERIFEVMDRAEANIFRIDFNIPARANLGRARQARQEGHNREPLLRRLFTAFKGYSVQISRNTYGFLRFGRRAQ